MNEASVEVRLLGSPKDIPHELHIELDAWGRSSDRALELIDPVPPEKVDAER